MLIKIIKRGSLFLAATLVLFFSVWTYLYLTPVTTLKSVRLYAQTVFELSCPAGTTSLQSLQTFNQSTGKYRQNYCVDVNGNVTESTATPTVTVNPATCTTGQTFFNTTTQQFLLCIATNTLSTASGSLATTIDTSLYGVVGNGRNVNNATWLINSAIVNSATGNFVNAAFPAGDIGKDFIGADTCIVGNAAASTSQSRFPAGTTVIAVNSATQIVVSNNSTAAVASNGCVTIGKNQDTALAAADVAAQASVTCPAVLFPQGIIMMKTAHFITQPAACPVNDPSIPGANPAGHGMRLLGQGKGVTIFVFMPGFSGASCIGGSAGDGCWGGQPGLDMEDFSFDGYGQVLTGDITGKVIMEAGYGTRIFNFACQNYSSGVGQGGGFRFAQNSLGYSEFSDSTLDACGAGTEGTLKVTAGGALYVHNLNISDGFGTNGIIIVDGAGTELISTGGFIGCAASMNTLGYIKITNGGTYRSANRDFFHTCGGGSVGQKMLNIVDATSTAILSGSNNFSTNINNSDGIFNAGTLVIYGDLIVGGKGTGFAIENVAGGKVFEYGRMTCCGDGTTGIISNLGSWFKSGSTTGTTQTGGNIVLSACGTSTVGTVSGAGGSGQFTITFAGAPGTTCTATITFPATTFPTPFSAVPLCNALDVGGNNAFPTSIINGAITTSSYAFTETATAFTNGNTEVIQYNCSVP